MRKPTFNKTVVSSLAELYVALVPHFKLLDTRYPETQEAIRLLRRIHDDKEWITKRVAEKTEKIQQRQRDCKMRRTLGVPPQPRAVPVNPYLHEGRSRPRLPVFSQSRRVALAKLGKVLEEWISKGATEWGTSERTARAYKFLQAQFDYCVYQGWLEPGLKVPKMPEFPGGTEMPTIQEPIDVEPKALPERVFHVGGES